MTHTLATLQLSPATYDEIKAKLEVAGYDHACHNDSLIDMSGIGLLRDTSYDAPPEVRTDTDLGVFLETASKLVEEHAQKNTGVSYCDRDVYVDDDDLEKHFALKFLARTIDSLIERYLRGY